MGRILTITGTGTHVGKTTVSLSILAWTEIQGIKSIWYKPIQCGMEPLPGLSRLGGDREWLEAFIPHSLRYVGLSLKMAASPHFAAESESIRINLSKMTEQAHQLSHECDLLIIEGAGGVAVPFDNKGRGLCDLVPVESSWWIVAAPGLGTLNHTRTAACFLESKNKKLSGFVFNSTEPEISDLAENNRETLSELMNVPCLGEIDYYEVLKQGKNLTRNQLVTLARPLESSLKKLMRV